MDERPQEQAGFGDIVCGEGDPLCQSEGSTVIRMQDPQN